jgi:hypothetical protein
LVIYAVYGYKNSMLRRGLPQRSSED